MANLASYVPRRAIAPNPPVGFYFLVTFFEGGVKQNSLDIRFQRVSGMNSTIETESVREGGENLFVHELPTRVRYDTLTLERGKMINTSALDEEFNATMSSLVLSPCNVLVMLLDQRDSPTAGWLFQNAYPVGWSTSDLDATQNAIVIDTLSLHYSRLKRLKV